MSNDVAKLRSYLDTHWGEEDYDEGTVIGLLEDCWHAFSGSDRTSLTVEKFYRIESIDWKPPTLMFAIERHGGTVQGSSRAEIHAWYLNLDTRDADCDESHSYRQTRPRRPVVRTRPLAEDIVGKIVAGEDDECLKWSDGGRCVKVIAGVALPAMGAYRQTLEGRRRRFRKDLQELMTAAGWDLVSGYYTFQRRDGR